MHRHITVHFFQCLASASMLIFWMRSASLILATPRAAAVFRATDTGFPLGMPVCTVIGAQSPDLRDRELLMMDYMVCTVVGHSVSGTCISALIARITCRISLQTASTVPLDHGT